MKEDKQNNKQNKFIIISDNEYSEEENETEINILEKERKDDEYFNETIDAIHRNLFSFINKNSIPLCEFLSIEKLETFITKYCN